MRRLIQKCPYIRVPSCCSRCRVSTDAAREERNASSRPSSGCAAGIVHRRPGALELRPNRVPRQQPILPRHSSFMTAGQQSTAHDPSFFSCQLSIASLAPNLAKGHLPSTSKSTRVVETTLSRTPSPTTRAASAAHASRHHVQERVRLLLSSSCPIILLIQSIFHTLSPRLASANIHVHLASPLRPNPNSKPLSSADFASPS